MKMKQVIDYAEAQANSQADSPFIQWLESDKLSAKSRLAAWMPCCALFAFGFKDLNSMVLKYPETEAVVDPLKKAINDHTEEDSRHWGWFLNDLKTLGLEGEQKFTDTLKLLWGNETQQQRFATYEICRLAEQAQDPILRYCLIETIEIFGNFLFGKMQKVSRQFTQETGTELKYLGPTHFQAELGHLANQSNSAESELWEITLGDPIREKALAISEQVSNLIFARWQEFFEFSQNHLAESKETLEAAY